jgi:hypothetical protein
VEGNKLARGGEQGRVAEARSWVELVEEAEAHVVVLVLGLLLLLLLLGRRRGRRRRSCRGCRGCATAARYSELSPRIRYWRLPGSQLQLRLGYSELWGSGEPNNVYMPSFSSTASASQNPQLSTDRQTDRHTYIHTYIQIHGIESAARKFLVAKLRTASRATRTQFKNS